MAEFYDTQAWIDSIKKNKFRTFLIVGLIILIFGSFVRLYKMECSRQTGVCVISQFYLEKLSYQKQNEIPLAQINEMIVSHTMDKWRRRGSAIPFYRLKLLTKSDSIELEMLKTPWTSGSKEKVAKKFNQFLQNTSQMTYTYREGMGFIWIFFGVLALAWVVFKKFYDECNAINRRIFNRKHNIHTSDDKEI